MEIQDVREKFPLVAAGKRGSLAANECRRNRYGIAQWSVGSKLRLHCGSLDCLLRIKSVFDAASPPELFGIWQVPEIASLS